MTLLECDIKKLYNFFQCGIVRYCIECTLLNHLFLPWFNFHAFHLSIVAQV